MAFPWGAAATVAGALISSRSDRRANEQNAALQREFAQHGIRWKVEDAKKAGLHPLYAMGAITPSAQASYRSSSMGEGISAAGRAMDRYQTDRIREKQRRAERITSNVRENAVAKSIINRNDAAAALDRASAAAIGRGNNGQNKPDGATKIQDQDVPLKGGLVKERPNEIPSPDKRHKEFRAGIAPGWQLKDLGPFQIVVPESDEGWGEDLGLTKLAVIAMATSAYYMGIGLKDLDAYIRKNYKKILASDRYKRIYKAITLQEGKKAGIRSKSESRPKSDKRRKPGFQKAPRPRTRKIP